MGKNESFDIAGAVFRALESQNEMPEFTEEFTAAWMDVKGKLTSDEHNWLWSAFMADYCQAVETAFRLGWSLRSQV